jgi:cyclase
VSRPAPEHEVARRLVPCLDVRDGQVVKGVRFRDHRVMGDIIELADRYRRDGADELVFYDITASPEGRSVDVDWVRRVSETIDIPFCVAGGIRSVESAARVLEQGADKISVNTPALEDPSLIDRLVKAFGSQCVVVGVDSIADDGNYSVRSHTGTPDRMRAPGRHTLDWLREVVARGAGEVVLNCMSADGTRSGYDIEQLAAARDILPIPLVASGGAGAIEHFTDVFQRADVDAALAATVFHSGQIPIPELKRALAVAGIEVRPC